MLMSVENLTKYFGDKKILENVTASVGDNDRIGIIGRNGAGKTTLLNILFDKMPYDSGKISMGRNTDVGYLKQNSGLESTSTIYEEMKKVFTELQKVENEIFSLQKRLSELAQNTESDEYKAAADRYALLTTYFENRDGYNADVKIKTVLNGMGFADRQLDTVINTLSGGERTRLSLARFLLLQPSLLVLDEPTNHLDFETLCWLEEYLTEYKGAIISVSHDRFFLDKTVKTVWEIDSCTLLTYSGNYSKYLVLRDEREKRQLKEYEQQQEKIAHLSDYVARNLVRATTSKSAKSKRNALERIEIIEKPKSAAERIPMKFTYEFEPNFEVLKIDGLTLSVGRGDDRKTLCEDISLTVERGDKLAVCGANGTGKTTLLKMIREYPSQNRAVRWGGNVKIGYYDQHLEILSPEHTVMEELWSRYPKRDPLSIRSTLGRAMFSGEDVFKKVGDLSGGEKARLSLAILMEAKPNVLIMDEPTNHLDLFVREALEEALFNYGGTLILVSHDRYFLEKIPNKILNLRDGKAMFFKEGYGEMTRYLSREKQEREEAALSQKKENEAQKSAQGYKNRKQRALDAKKRSELARLENETARLDAKISELEALLSDPQIFSDYQRSKEICDELEKSRREYDEALEEWLMLGDEQG